MGFLDRFRTSKDEDKVDLGGQSFKRSDLEQMVYGRNVDTDSEGIINTPFASKDEQAKYKSEYKWLFEPRNGVRWDFNPVKIRSLAQEDAWVQMLVNNIAQEIAHTPGQIVENDNPEVEKNYNPFERVAKDKDGDKATKDVADEARKMIKNPNPDEDQSDVLVQAVSDMLEIGSVCAVKMFSTNDYDGDTLTSNNPTLLHWKTSAPETFTKGFDGKTGILEKYYQYDKTRSYNVSSTGTSDKGVTEFKPEEIMWMDLHPRSNRRYGMPPTLPVKDFLQLMDLTMEQEQRFWSRGALVAGFIASDGDIEELDTLQGEMDSAKGKPDKSLMHISDPNAKYQEIGVNWSQLKMGERMERYAKVIASEFQVPMSVVGLKPERVNRSTFRAERENFESNTLGPYMQKVERWINDNLIYPHFGEDIRWEFKPGMSEEQKRSISERVSREFNSNLITRGEAREQIGYDVLDDDEEDGYKNDVIGQDIDPEEVSMSKGFTREMQSLVMLADDPVVDRPTEGGRRATFHIPLSGDFTESEVIDAESIAEDELGLDVSVTMTDEGVFVEPIPDTGVGAVEFMHPHLDVIESAFDNTIDIQQKSTLFIGGDADGYSMQPCFMMDDRLSDEALDEISRLYEFVTGVSSNPYYAENRLYLDTGQNQLAHANLDVAEILVRRMADEAGIGIQSHSFKVLEETSSELVGQNVDSQEVSMSKYFLKQDDVFDTIEEAQRRAEELGLEGYHSHETDDGDTVYMPGVSHDRYEEVTGKSILGKPFGPWQDFEDCTSDMEQDGYSTEDAKRICGSLQADLKSDKKKVGKKDLEDIDTKPPQSVADEARMALDARDNDDYDNDDCGTRTGWERANQLDNREDLSEDTINRMVSFLNRSEQYAEVDGDIPKQEDCGWLMYKAWGGDAGKTWAENKAEEFENVREDKSVDKEPLRNTTEWDKFGVQPADVRDLENEIKEDINSFFDELLSDERFLDLIDSFAKDQKNSASLQRLMDTFLGDVSLSEQIQEIVMEKVAEKAIERLEATMESTGLQVEKDPVLERVKNRDMTFSNDYTQRVRDEIRDTISEGWQKEKTTREIRQDIQDKVEDFTENQAEVIARDQLQRANGEARNAFAKEHSDKYVEEWITAGDDRVRPAHQEMDGTWKRPSEEFEVEYGNDTVKESYPGDSRQGIQCRCDTLLKDVEDVENSDHRGV